MNVTSSLFLPLSNIEREIWQHMNWIILQQYSSSINMLIKRLAGSRQSIGVFYFLIYGHHCGANLVTCYIEEDFRLVCFDDR